MVVGTIAMMMSLQNAAASRGSDRAAEVGFAAVKQEPAASLTLVPFKGHDSHEGWCFLFYFYFLS